MKKCLFIFIFLLFSLYSYAKIWRVNNNSGITADFTTVQAAHNGAASGDTLHIEGSPNQYGSLDAKKKLVIIGPGFFLDLNPNLQAFTQTAKLSTIYFNPGSEGSVIMGIDLAGNGIQVYSNDIVIKRNKFSSPSGSVQDFYTGNVTLYYLNNGSSTPVNNIVISQNYGLAISIQYPSTGVLITNNYIATGAAYGEQYNAASINSHSNAVLLIQNNIFRRGKVTVYNSSITNNIMYAGFFEGTSNLVSNNISSNTQFGTANNNKSDIDMSTVFVATGSPDEYYKLKPGSPAIGAGYGSTAQTPVDAGMFGGQTPYVLSGIPPIPSIYFFENQPVGSSSDPIDVTIKVRANN